MTERYFVDTNVFVYDQDPTDAAKHERASAWIETLWRARAGRLSAQVLIELYAVLTRKLRKKLPPEEARSLVETLEAWEPVPTNGELLHRAWSVESQFGLAWRDALIVAAAQTTGCRYLLSEDLQHGRDYDGVKVLDPFRTTPLSWPPSHAHDAPR